MDGNGRWAKLRGMPRLAGHREGAKRVDDIVTECTKIDGLDFLTLYTFSTENWNRPSTEVKLLMRLLVENLKTMDKKLAANGVKFSSQGSLELLPAYVRKELDRVEKLTDFKKPNLQLSLALSYGGRQEIIDVAKKLARRVVEGELSIDKIDEEEFRKHLYHPHFPDPDLIIRTGGESRLSNFLLWEAAYSELVSVDTHWPDFKTDLLHEALKTFSKRLRRFGKTSEQVQPLSAQPVL